MASLTICAGEPMKLKFIIALFIFFLTPVFAGTERHTFDGVNVYAMQWKNILMYNMSLDKFRKVSEIRLTSSDSTFATDLAKELRIQSVNDSQVNASESFTTYVVLDFISDGKMTTYLSDGKQLCTEDRTHCTSVDETFKERFDPSYNK